MSQVFKIRFFTYLMILLANSLYFRLVIGLHLTIDLAIGGAELMDRKIAATFSKYSL